MTTKVDEPIRVMIVDDQAPTRLGLGLMVRKDPGLRVMLEAESGQQAIDRLAQAEELGRALPQVVLMDVRMPVLDGIDATATIVRRWPTIHVLILTTYDEDDYAFTGLHAGAYGFLLKDVSTRDLHRAIRAVADGDAVLTPRITAEIINRDRAHARRKNDDDQARQQLGRLTPREYEIAGLIAQGLSNQEIAQRLTIEVASVRRYVSRILDKTGLRDRTQIVIAWFRSDATN